MPTIAIFLTDFRPTSKFYLYFLFICFFLIFSPPYICGILMSLTQQRPWWWVIFCCTGNCGGANWACNVDGGAGPSSLGRVSHAPANQPGGDGIKRVKWTVLVSGPRTRRSKSIDHATSSRASLVVHVIADSLNDGCQLISCGVTEIPSNYQMPKMPFLRYFQ